MSISMSSMRRSRHPLVRALSVLVGLAVIGVLLVFGLAVAAVLLVGGLVLLALRQWKHSGASTRKASTPAGYHQPDVLEGEFVVIRQEGRPVAH